MKEEQLLKCFKKGEFKMIKIKKNPESCGNVLLTALLTSAACEFIILIINICGCESGILDLFLIIAMFIYFIFTVMYIKLTFKLDSGYMAIRLRYVVTPSVIVHNNMNLL